MQAKHCFFEENTMVRIPAGTTLLVFSREEIELVRFIIDAVCTRYGYDILKFEYLLNQLNDEENEQ